MIKKKLILCLLCLIVALNGGCGGHPITRPTVLLDAENDTNEGIHAFAESNWQRAQRLFNRALSVYQGLDHQQGILESYINLAEVALSVRDYHASHGYLDKAADIIKTSSLGDYQRRITLLNVQQALQENQIALAESFLQPLLSAFNGTIAATVPDTIQITAIANRTKIAFMRHQDEALWVQGFAEALKISDMKNYDLEARLLRFQSSLLQSQGDYSASESKLEQALSIYKNNLSRTGIAVTLAELGQLYMHQSQWQKALDYFNRSITVYQYLGDSDNVNQMTKNRGEVELELSNQQARP
jgi:tetratricopeptide (TPR) repeat protein